MWSPEGESSSRRGQAKDSAGKEQPFPVQKIFIIYLLLQPMYNNIVLYRNKNVYRPSYEHHIPYLTNVISFCLCIYFPLIALRTMLSPSWVIIASGNTLRPGQDGRHFQTTFSNAFSWMKMIKFRLRFHWSLFPRVQLTILQHWFR